jgi:hypothetical protein
MFFSLAAVQTIVRRQRGWGGCKIFEIDRVNPSILSSGPLIVEGPITWHPGLPGVLRHSVKLRRSCYWEAISLTKPVESSNQRDTD